MHNAAYEALGLDWVYVPLPLEDETDLMRFMGAARVLPFVGFNVTMPFKQAMLTMCDEVAMLATMAGAVNTVHCVDGRFIGYNTDARGLVEALQAEVGFSSEGRDIVIIGAGGAAGAAAVGFMLGRANRITIANRSLERAEELYGRLAPHVRTTEVAVVSLSDAEEAISSAAAVINATPVGMTPSEPSPVPTAWLRPGQVVCDMLYGPHRTQLLVDAESAGATAVSGLGMLVAQGALAVDIWSESAQTRAPRDVMHAAAVDALRGVQAGEAAPA